MTEHPRVHLIPNGPRNKQGERSHGLSIVDVDAASTYPPILYVGKTRHKKNSGLGAGGEVEAAALESISVLLIVGFGRMGDRVIGSCGVRPQGRRMFVAKVCKPEWRLRVVSRVATWSFCQLVQYASPRLACVSLYQFSASFSCKLANSFFLNIKAKLLPIPRKKL